MLNVHKEMVPSVQVIQTCLKAGDNLVSFELSER